MSGDTNCTTEAIWKCPFCGRPTWKIELPEQWGEIHFPDGHVESCYDDGITNYDNDHWVKELILRIECEDTKKGNSAEYTCPAMSEMGAYNLHIYPTGDCHAYYY